MADGKIKISELTSALQINDDAKFPYSQDNSGTTTTFGAEITQIARKIAEGVTLTNLQTTTKNLVGAINEIAGSSSAVILYGTSAPTSSQGDNGNLYVKYTAGTGGASDTVDALYVKLDDDWCEIETGGGSSSLADLTDTQITSPADKEVLQYDGTSQKWKNKSTSIEKTIQNVAIASFTDGADNVPLSELEVEIEPNLSGVSAVTITNKDDLYNPTQTDTYTVSLGGTYYGGMLDITKGVLTVTHANIDMGDMVWTKGNTSLGGYYPFISTSIASLINPVYDRPAGICNTYDYVKWSSRGGNKITNNSSGHIYVYPINYQSDTGEQFKEHSVGSKITYELATPTTVRLTPTQVKTLLGNNNIFADSGDIEKITYFNINADELADLISVYSNLNALSDVDISNPTNNQVLVYNATTKKWENGTIASGGGHNYSTTEQIIGTWIDGSTLYEKTIYDAGGAYGEIYIPHGVSNLEKIVYAEGVCADNGATPYNYYPFSRISGDGNNVGISVTTTGAVSVYVPSAFQQRIVDIYVTIRYTKSST